MSRYVKFEHIVTHILGETYDEERGKELGDGTPWEKYDVMQKVMLVEKVTPDAVAYVEIVKRILWWHKRQESFL